MRGERYTYRNMSSHVTLEQHVCLVCGKAWDTGVVLMDPKLRPVFESDHTPMGFGLCHEHEQKFKDGYVALVCIDPSKSTPTGKPGDAPVLRPENAWRTGEVMHVKRTVWDRLFTTAAPDGPVCYIDKRGFEAVAQRCGKG
jgi:hypothetical protein